MNISWSISWIYLQEFPEAEFFKAIASKLVPWMSLVLCCPRDPHPLHKLKRIKKCINWHCQQEHLCKIICGLSVTHSLFSTLLWINKFLEAAQKILWSQLLQWSTENPSQVQQCALHQLENYSWLSTKGNRENYTANSHYCYVSSQAYMPLGLQRTLNQEKTACKYLQKL